MCSKAHLRGTEESARLRYLEDVVYPTLQGAHGGRASGAVHLLHRSCVRFLLDPSTTPEVIWAQMVDVLRYNVEVLLRSSVTSPWSRNLTLKLKPVIPNVPLLSDSPRTNRELLGRLLSFLRSSLNVSATAEGLRRLASVVASKDSPENSTAEEEEVTGRIFLLNEYMSKATFKVWVASLKAVCACDNVVYAEVKIYDAKLFAAQVDVCADTEYRDDLLSYIMAAASANLFQKSLVASAGQDSPTRLDTCTSWVLDMRHIWDMVAIERHADAAKDKVLRSLFDATVRTAAKDVETLFSTSVEGAASLRHFLSRLVLLHPKKVNDLYAYLLPNFESGQHVRNRFAVREFSVRTLAMDAALDLSDKRSLRAGASGPLVIISKRYVFFSPSIYSEMRMDCGPANSSFLNAHLAAHLADSLAQKIHAEAVNGRFRGLVVPESLGCSGGDSLGQQTSPTGKLRCPLPTLRIVARAMPFDVWRHQWATLGVWNVTHSQVFFMLFYLGEMCAVDSDVERGGVTVPILLQLPEFRDAFGCHSPPPTTTPTYVTISSPAIVNLIDSFL
ncbi:hypothetical protein MTO96_027844 [Rhipicephalus appendiculatus]